VGPPKSGDWYGDIMRRSQDALYVETSWIDWNPMIVGTAKVEKWLYYSVWPRRMPMHFANLSFV